MTHFYRHISAEGRAAIIMMRATHPIRAIATHLGRTPSTMSREIARHTVDLVRAYDAAPAGCSARLTPGLVSIPMHPDGGLFEVVIYLLRKYWSPEQIAHTLTRMATCLLSRKSPAASSWEGERWNVTLCTHLVRVTGCIHSRKRPNARSGEGNNETRPHAPTWSE